MSMTNSQFESLLSEAILEYGEDYIEIPEEMWKPHKFSLSFEWRMRRLIRQEKKAYKAEHMTCRKPFSYVPLRKFPLRRRVTLFIIILIAASFFVTDAGASQNFIPGYILDDRPRDTLVTVDPATFAPDASDHFDEFYELTWVPSGYVLTEMDRSDFWNSMTYENKDGGYISFFQHAVVNYRAGYDNEHSDMEYIRINDCDGFTLVDDGCASIVWHDGKNLFAINYMSGDQFDKTGVALLAKSVQKVESE